MYIELKMIPHILNPYAAYIKDEFIFHVTTGLSSRPVILL